MKKKTIKTSCVTKVAKQEILAWYFCQKNKYMENYQTILDVRTYDEFCCGHAPGSTNIPLQDLPRKIEEVKKLPQPLLLCCASGVRSSQAEMFLKQHGIDCKNAGSWINIKPVR